MSEKHAAERLREQQISTWTFRLGAKLGEAEKAICWYKPTGSQDYRVIFGDLSVRDVPAAEIPNVITKR